MKDMTRAKIAAKQLQDLRPYLLPILKEKFGDKCINCGTWHRSYNIHHLRYGDRITIDDLELLCADCHRLKTIEANELGFDNTPHCATCTCFDCS